MMKFFSNPYDIFVYGRLPDYINTSLYFVDFTKGGKLFLKDPVVKGLQELYPISNGAHLKLNSIQGINRLISFNGCIPFHIMYSIMDHLNINNNYPVLVPRKEKNSFSDVNINLYTDYWMKKIDENNIKEFISENIQKTKVKHIQTNNPFSGYISYYGIFSGYDKDGDININSDACIVETYLGNEHNYPCIYKKEGKKLNYVLNNNIPYYTSRYLIDKIRNKNLLISFNE